MINDLKFLVYSYLTLEEILNFTKNNKILRDRIISKHFKVLPHINIASKNGNLETVKYLHEGGIEPTVNAINWASMDGHLDVVKYLFENGIVDTDDAIKSASWNGRLEVVKYLFEKDIELYDTTSWGDENGYVNTIKNLFGGDVKYTNNTIHLEKEHLKMLEYFKSKGY